MPEVINHDLIAKLEMERKAAFDYRERRHQAWDEIYALYRNKVQTNRLTQRQAVYVPLMKETIKTLLSKVDEAPNIDWKEKGGDALKSLFVQAQWDDDFNRFNYEGVDIIDKKNALLCGRGIKKLNIAEGGVKIIACDPYDILIDPLTNPLDIETARFIVNENIFKSIKEIAADDKYSAEGKEKLKGLLSERAGLLAKDNDTNSAFNEKFERMKTVGMDSTELERIVGADTMVSLSEHLTTCWNDKSEKWERRVIVLAEKSIVLYDKTLMDTLGVEFWPYVTWGEDTEALDYWSDGVGDLVLTPNKLINVWFSQLVENRTLRNFQMHWYDATVENYAPQTYEPGAGRMLPAPGDPHKTIMPVEISGMDETMNAIDFIIKMVERGTAATAIEKGTSERSQITLGEVKMLVGKAMERTVSMAKAYRRSWYETAMKWAALTQANATERKLSKMSSKGRLWTKTVLPKDWESDKGFEAMVRSSGEQDDEKTASIQRVQFLMQQFPQNAALRRIGQRRMLDIANLTPEEVREIVEEEKRMIDEQEQMAELGGQSAGLPTGALPNTVPTQPTNPNQQAPLTAQPQMAQPL